MDNLTLFLNGFLSYLLVFAVFGVTILVACLIGIALRKNKNARTAVTDTEGSDESAAQE